MRCVAPNAGEGLAAAGIDTGRLVLLRIPDREFCAEGVAHGDRIEALAWSGSRLLASGSRDRTVKLWDCDGGELRELLTLRLPAPVRWLAFHPDGVRLFVLLDREQAVRVWHLDPLRTRLTELGLGDGLDIFAPLPLPASVREPPGAPPLTIPPEGPNGLRTELFADMELRRCVKVRYDASVNWNWGAASPDPLLPVDRFSIRWTGWLKAPRPGQYTLRLSSDDGARLWLDGRLRIHQWGNSAGYPVEVELSDQPHALRIEYFEAWGDATTSLTWAQQDGFSMQPVRRDFLFHERSAAEMASVPQFQSWGTTPVAWGSNNTSQLDFPATLTNAVAIAAGACHSVALKADGAIVGWGLNSEGQTTGPEGLSDVVAIAAGNCYGLALKGDATVVAWGQKNLGQATVPKGLSSVVAIAAGTYHSLALQADGTVVAWGDNSKGELTPPVGLRNVVAIDAGCHHSLALQADGILLGWGWNPHGQTTVPAGLKSVIAIAAGSYHSLALQEDGIVVAWGLNPSAQTTVRTGLRNVAVIAADYEVN